MWNISTQIVIEKAKANAEKTKTWTWYLNRITVWHTQQKLLNKCNFAWHLQLTYITVYVIKALQSEQ